ncbi:unnamed protein product [Ixodes hexagonus]
MLNKRALKIAEDCCHSPNLVNQWSPGNRYGPIQNVIRLYPLYPSLHMYSHGGNLFSFLNFTRHIYVAVQKWGQVQLHTSFFQKVVNAKPFIRHCGITSIKLKF